MWNEFIPSQNEFIPYGNVFILLQVFPYCHTLVQRWTGAHPSSLLHQPAPVHLQLGLTLLIKTNALFPYHFSEQFLHPAPPGGRLQPTTTSLEPANFQGSNYYQRERALVIIQYLGGILHFYPHLHYCHVSTSYHLLVQFYGLSTQQPSLENIQQFSCNLGCNLAEFRTRHRQPLTKSQT